jgi:uncharacterized membrane protein HdeD (DUF308 family)
VLLGFFAIFAPVATSLAVVLMLSVLILIGGVSQLISAFRLRRSKGSLWRFASSALSIIAGVLMLRYPGGGLIGVALILSYYFFLSAGVQWAIAMAMRPHDGWGWGIFGAIASFFIGVYLIWNLPVSALWVPGVLLGVEFISRGIALIGVSLYIRPERLGAGGPLHPAQQL